MTFPIPEPLFVQGYRTSDYELHETPEAAKEYELKFQMARRLRSFECVNWYGKDFDDLVEFALSLLPKE